MKRAMAPYTGSSPSEMPGRAAGLTAGGVTDRMARQQSPSVREQFPGADLPVRVGERLKSVDNTMEAHLWRTMRCMAA